MSTEIEPIPLRPPCSSDASRRLATIMYADAVDFTRLAGREEDWTLQAIANSRRRFVRNAALQGGRVRGTPGDAILAEFPSVSGAVTAAVETQRELSAVPLISPAKALLQFRIGLHLAEIVDHSDDILGDGVNLAARVAAAAEPGGIRLSAPVYDQICHRLELLCSDMGELSLKNVERPVRLYRVDLAPETMAGSHGVRQGSVLLVPYRPSVAVLPFADPGRRETEDYIADGVADALINALSRSRWFYVIARSSAFRFRDSSADIREIGRALGARYIVQGSLQRAGAKLRVVAQLVDSASAALLCSHAHDGDLADVFAVQDAFAQRIAAAVEPGVLKTEAAAKAAILSANSGALDHVLRAYRRLWEMTPEGMTEATAHLQTAVAMDGTVQQAYVALAMAAVLDVYMGWAENAVDRLKAAREAAINAMRLDCEDAWAQMALGLVCMQTDAVDDAIGLLRTSIELNPSLSLAYGFLANAMIFDGQLSEAESLLRFAMRLSPSDPMLMYWQDGLAMVHHLAGRNAAALHWARLATQQGPYWPGAFRTLAIIQGLNGDSEAAARALARMLELQPNTSLNYLRRIWPFRDRNYFETNLRGLRAAGWHADDDR